ncbi:hypothetical protein PV327_001637 [Microctonus hyperodae]|uniref:Exuperantia RNAse H-like domain-containing protein n=1 Tax=Microctonus hyperodae TaxID=165561 RepID=A0AA39FE33_MICHY|nr:hypothetical protein PV327_001637 [Microctonus hyperodae]
MTYRRNCGITTAHESENTDSLNDNDEMSQTTKVVYFDLETSGLESSSEILQIAPIGDNIEYSSYILPTKAIPASTTKINGLKFLNGQLYYKNMKVNALNMDNTLKGFSQYLHKISDPCLLVAHNSRFDVPKLVTIINDLDLLDSFKVIQGFSDTLTLFKKELPERSGPGVFKLSTLAKDLIGIEDSDSFHEGAYNVLNTAASQTPENTRKSFTRNPRMRRWPGSAK